MLAAHAILGHCPITDHFLSVGVCRHTNKQQYCIHNMLFQNIGYICWSLRHVCSWAHHAFTPNCVCVLTERQREREKKCLCYVSVNGASLQGLLPLRNGCNFSWNKSGCLRSVCAPPGSSLASRAGLDATGTSDAPGGLGVTAVLRGASEEVWSLSQTSLS